MFFPYARFSTALPTRTIFNQLLGLEFARHVVKFKTQIHVLAGHSYKFQVTLFKIQSTHYKTGKFPYCFSQPMDFFFFFQPTFLLTLHILEPKVV